MEERGGHLTTGQCHLNKATLRSRTLRVDLSRIRRRRGIFVLWLLVLSPAVAVVRFPVNAPQALAFSPRDSNLLAVAAADGVQLWSLDGPSLLRHFPTATAAVGTTFDPSGAYLFGAELYGRITVWDLSTGTVVRTLQDVDWLLAIDHHPTEPVLAVAGAYEVRLLDAQSGATLRRIPVVEWVHDVRFGAAGSVLVVSGDDFRTNFIDPGTGEIFQIFFHFGPAVSGLLTPDGTVTVAGDEFGTVRFWDARTRRLLREFPVSRWLEALAVSPAGDRLAIAHSGAQDEVVVRSLDTALNAPPLPWDLTGDGVVDLFDLLTVARKLGQFGGQAAGDVNGDGVVNILDLVLVAAHFGEQTFTLAAPTFPGPKHRALLERWVAAADRLSRQDPVVRQGRENLRRLLAQVATPIETALLPSFPNPFNPETWIPFRLARQTSVTIRIYNAQGALVRQFELGTLPPGRYERPNRAVRWDGRNAQGEPVASGLYLVELRADDRRFVRRVLVAK